MQLPDRKDVKTKNTWALEDLFPTNESWEEEFLNAKKEIVDYNIYKNTVGKSPEHMLKALQVLSEISLKIERIYVYASMKRDQDTADGFYLAMADRAMSLAVSWGSESSFIIPEITAIDESELKSWSEIDDLASYKHMLQDIIRSKAHLLSDKEERILAMSGEIASAPNTVYTMLNNADMKFPDIEVGSKKMPLTHGSYIKLMEDRNRDVRKAAFTTLYDTYSGLKNTFASTLSSSVKGDIFGSKARNYDSALDAALYSDNVPKDVYTSLISAVHDSLPLMHRYMNLRKKVMNLDELHMYDIYAPISSADFPVDYDEAKKMVKNGLAPLGKEYGDLLDKAYADRWIDVYENKNKKSGAYCWGSYGTHPYVLLNHQDNINSVFTLAHELGHAMHSYLSDEKQVYENAQYKILVAEVASTVNEALLMEYLLENEKDKNKRILLLNYYLEQFRTTLYRQVMFAEFEMIIHEAQENGEALTAEFFEGKYLALNKLYYGEEMDHSDGIAMEWSRIPHFYSAFYVYKYATGFSAAVAISDAILNDGESAREKYMEFLSSGGRDYPLELLKITGVDLTKPDTVKNALKVFEKSLDRFEELL